MNNHRKSPPPGRIAGALFAAVLLSILLTAAPAPAGNFSAIPEKAGGKVLMDFQDADIRQIISFMQDATGRIIIADSEVKGTITIASSAQLTVEEAMDVLNSALKAKGYTMVQADNIIRIIKLDESKQTNVPTEIGGKYMDIAGSEQVITRVVPLSHVDAEKIRADLKALVGKDGEILSNQESNSIIITDTSANVKRLLQIIEFLDRESPRQIQIRVYNLDYAKAKDLAALISQLPKSSGGTPAAQEAVKKGTTTYPSAEAQESAPTTAKSVTGALQISGEITVLADERSNSLIIATAPQNFASIEKLIESLDRMLSQVLIEVVIMEASLDNSSGAGVEWNLLKQIIAGDSAYQGNGKLDYQLAAQTFGLKAQLLKANGAGQLLAFLMKQKQNINILSTPIILTSDNQEASILVGSEVPYLKETRRSVGDTLDYVYEYKNVGIQLKVTPHINEQRFVVMDIHQEIKKLGPQTLFNAYIIISREADAKVVAKDNQTVVLGGLIGDDKTTTKNSVPFFSKIPLLGKLFDYNTTTGEKTELLVFITPHVVANQAEIDKITKEQQERMKTLQIQKKHSENEEIEKK